MVAYSIFFCLLFIDSFVAALWCIKWEKKTVLGVVVNVFVKSNGLFRMMLLNGEGDVGAQRVGANYAEFAASF